MTLVHILKMKYDTGIAESLYQYRDGAVPRVGDYVMYDAKEHCVRKVVFSDSVNGKGVYVEVWV